MGFVSNDTNTKEIFFSVSLRVLIPNDIPLFAVPENGILHVVTLTVSIFSSTYASLHEHILVLSIVSICYMPLLCSFHNVLLHQNYTLMALDQRTNISGTNQGTG